MMVLSGPWETWEPAAADSSATIGVLDGVHLGHRALLALLDPNAMRTVLTFDPHPIEVLRPGTPARLLTNISERVDLLGRVGVDCVGVLDLAEIKDLSPERFVAGVLVDKMRIRHLVVGKDFRFGRDRSGDVGLLISLGETHGFRVEVIDLVVAEDGQVVSSSRIRSLVEAGRVAEAAAMLGSWFQLTNTVVAGDSRGHQIGFPTANLRPPPRKLAPADGVYAGFAIADGERHAAAISVGVRPTFGGGERLIEAFLLDFSGDLYGRELVVEFVRYLRPELAFDGVDELVEQMEADVAASRAIVAEAGTPDMSL